MTPVGVVEGEVLRYLERYDSVSLRQLNRELPQPAYMVVMAVGALVRAGLVRAVQRDLDVTVKRRMPLFALR